MTAPSVSPIVDDLPQASKARNSSQNKQKYSTSKLMDSKHFAYQKTRMRAEHSVCSRASGPDQEMRNPLHSLCSHHATQVVSRVRGRGQSTTQRMRALNHNTSGNCLFLRKVGELCTGNRKVFFHNFLIELFWREVDIVLAIQSAEIEVARLPSAEGVTFSDELTSTIANSPELYSSTLAVSLLGVGSNFETWKRQVPPGVPRTRILQC